MKQITTHASRLLLISAMLSSALVFANQIPDPDISQKDVIGEMHHQLHNDQAPYKAKETQSLKELNAMTILDNVDIKAVNQKIDELMTAKKHIMRLRYAHLIEMRAILTEDQKVGYDKGVLGRSAVR